MDVSINLTPGDIAAIADATAARILAATPPAEAKVPRLLFNEKEAAESLGISGFTLRNWRQQGLVTPHSVVKPIVYTREQIADIAAWMATRGDDSN